MVSPCLSILLLATCIIFTIFSMSSSWCHCMSQWCVAGSVKHPGLPSTARWNVVTKMTTSSGPACWVLASLFQHLHIKYLNVCRLLTQNGHACCIVVLIFILTSFHPSVSFAQLCIQAFFRNGNHNRGLQSYFSGSPTLCTRRTHSPAPSADATTTKSASGSLNLQDHSTTNCISCETYSSYMMLNLRIMIVSVSAKSVLKSKRSLQTESGFKWGSQWVAETTRVMRGSC